MMRRRVVIPALLLASLGSASSIARAQYGPGNVPVADASQRFTPQQLDNLTGPVALYPDALLAQVLVAATFPDQLEDAADFVRTYGTDSIDVQSWDVSVKAVAHYPSALNAMADKIDWTAALGKAYATQSSDVMASVQRLRRMAADQGNLNTTPQQKIVTVNDTYQIVPVEPRVIYVPVYDPYVIYSRPVFNVGFTSRFWSFGVGFPIGSWLAYDCDWGLRRVYYNGWSPTYYGFGGGWRARSRPFIQITNVYVSPRYANVYINRNVINRSVNYYNVDRYASVHGGRHFDGRRDGRYDSYDDGRSTRFAVRNDGDNRSGAVNGRGYSAGALSQRPSGRNDSNDRSDNNGYGTRSNVPRSGSGYANNGSYGGRDGNGRGNVSNNDNRDRTSAGNTNRDRGNGSVDNRGAQPPQQRRSEPLIRSGNEPQTLVPDRQGESQQSRGAASRIIAPQRSAERPSNSGRFSYPQQPDVRQSEPQRQTQSWPSQRSAQAPRVEQQRSAPAPRVEQQRSSSPQVSRPQSSGSAHGAGARAARPRGGDNPR